MRPEIDVLAIFDVDPPSGRFQARISVHKKQIHLGCYDTPAEANTVYMAKRKEFYGDFA